jgi:hypothetical protein
VAVPLLVAVAAADLRTAVLGESEWGLWASALEPDGWLGESPPAGPLYLGLAVQLGLLLTPLIAAPARSAVVPLARAVRRAALPAAFVAIAALALIQFPSTDELYAVPLMALGLSVVAAAIVTGAGALWLRVPAAILVPAFIHPALVEDGPHYLGPTTVQMLMVACGSSVVVLGTLAAPKAHSILMRIRSVDHSDSVPATSA